MLMLGIEEDWCVGLDIASGLGSDVGDRIEIGDAGEVGLEFWDEVGSRYVRGGNKHVKGIFDVILYERGD